MTENNQKQAEMTVNYVNSNIYQRESILDRARFVTQRDGEMDIVVLGSSVTKGLGATESQPVWGELLEQYLNAHNEIAVNVQNHGHSGYSTSDLIKNNKIVPVIEEEPDLIIFELCLINNNRYPQNTLVQTKADIQWIMEAFARELPGTLVVFTTANPTIYNDVLLADGKITYDQYNKEIATFITEQNWPLIDVYQLMMMELDQHNRVVVETLEDHVHPNGNGYQLWFDVMVEKLNVPVSGL
ncbi:SGNH/GDSL hydrolase family protein [Desemzia sp. RIT804]|uniref:SGNH/GDSL hydrolase family protein n=1 Tax=Desemzia sp. RIT 804 TaxID=2810209 RepID=UPI00194FD013|nr:SGNH/GDSL hydrolase family protein [Desemzia sp. RIT 804]MBM6615942.1 SGNH/GDSL hydrolase family protein [Desemzia sp. RIT 804]